MAYYIDCCECLINAYEKRDADIINRLSPVEAILWNVMSEGDEQYTTTYTRCSRMDLPELVVYIQRILSNDEPYGYSHCCAMRRLLELTRVLKKT